MLNFGSRGDYRNVKVARWPSTCVCGHFISRTNAQYSKKQPTVEKVRRVYRPRYSVEIKINECIKRRKYFKESTSNNDGFFIGKFDGILSGGKIAKFSFSSCERFFCFFLIFSRFSSVSRKSEFSRGRRRTDQSKNVLSKIGSFHRFSDNYRFDCFFFFMYTEK